MFCTQCGSTLGTSDQFCGNCGCAISPEASIAAKIGTAETIPAPPQPTPASDDKTIAQVRPWVRFLARIVDIVLFSALCVLAIAVLAPEFAGTISGFGLEFLVVAAWVYVESLLLAIFGTTPGKWLLRTRLDMPASTKFTIWGRTLDRSFNVWVRGLGVGIPILALVTMAVAYHRLIDSQRSSWDVKNGFTIVHERIGAIRLVAALLVVAIPFALIGYGIAVTES